MRFDALRLACGAALALSAPGAEAAPKVFAVGSCGAGVPGLVRIPVDPDDATRDPVACHAATGCVRDRRQRMKRSQLP